MKNENQKNGYIALVSVLIISSITLFLAINANLFGISESGMALRKSHSSKSFYLANLCAEDALMKLKNNLDYSGDETLSLDGGSCYISSLEGSGNEDRIIKTSGNFNDQTRRIIIEIGRVNPLMEISSWREVSSF
jgi:hypothetical protein